MAALLRGTVYRPGGDSGGIVVELVSKGPGGPVLGTARVAADGSFEIRHRDGAPNGAVIRVRPAVGGRVLAEAPVAATDLGGRVVVSLPGPPIDPRDQVAAVVEALSHEKDALATTRTVLSAQIEARRSDDEVRQQAVASVVEDLAPHAGADLRWRVTAQRPLTQLRREAVSAGKARIAANPPIVLARQGSLSDGDQLPTDELVVSLAGSESGLEGYRRRSAVEARRRRRMHRGDDGMPRPLPLGTASQPGGDGDTDGSAQRPTEEIVKERVNDLVEAIRLPEEPPLLTADEAVASDGSRLQLAGGIADVTAIHDFHELVLAMPNVWHDVVDRRMVDVLDSLIGSMVDAGLDVEAVMAAAAPPGPKRKLAAVLQAARGLEAMYRTSSAAGIRPPRRPLPLAPASLSGNLVSAGVVDQPRVVFLDTRDETTEDTHQDGGVGGGGGGSGGDAGGGRPGGLGGLGGTGTSTDGIGDQFVDPSRPMGLLAELERYLTGAHSFTVFAADGTERAMNFGVLLTWRQTWEPLTYQTGEIAHTMTLAPGEERTITTRRRRTLKRYTAEAERAQRSQSMETTDTSRAEAEILRKAEATTNFQLSSGGSTKLLVADGSFSTSGSREVGKTGNDTRRRFREAVVKAAQEYREEHSLEVRTESEETFEEESTARVRNVNDELALTAVFYTLQRRYRVAEHLYRARPVVLVAMPVPDPAEITAAWIIRHDWILRRNLLDDSFAPALEYLATSYLGDQEVLVHLEQAVATHRQALEETRSVLASARTAADQRAKALNELRMALAEGREPSMLEELPGLNLAVAATNFVGDLFGGGDDETAQREREATLVEAAEDELARAERQAQEAEAQLAAVQSAFQEATAAYVDAKRQARNQEVQIARVRGHISANAVYYLQRIWASEPPDQRFFELHAVQVPMIRGSVRLTSQGTIDDTGVGGFTPEQFEATLSDPDGELNFRPLAEVADLDQLLGFKGNYAIFPLRDGNALTDLILAPYLDESEILRDPDDLAANWNLTELRDYADQLRAEVQSGTITQQEFDDIHAPFLRDTLERLLTDPNPSEEIVVVPSDSLYVDLLISGGRLLEPFKLEHRGIDVAKARAETRWAELKNLLLAARLDEGELEDPDVDKRIIVEGASDVIVTPGDG